MNMIIRTAGTMLLVMLVTAFLSAGLAVNAMAQSIETQHVYVMGDSDSRTQATRLCYAEAERAALEQAGVYMESRTRIDNFTLAADEVRSVTAAVVQVERLGDSLLMEGQRLSVQCRCRVSFDPEAVREQLRRIAANAAARRELQAADEAVRDAERRIKPSSTTGEGVHDDTVPDIDDLEALRRKRDAIVRRNAQLDTAGRTAVVRGMTQEQVASLLGVPQASHTMNRGGHQYLCGRYGSVWVVYRDNAALCLRKRLENRSAEGLCSCAGSADSFIWR